MTIREVSFVYPLVRTLTLAKDLEAARKSFLDGFLAKLQPIMEDLAAQDTALKRKHGERVASIAAEPPTGGGKAGAQQQDNDKYILRTEEQNEAFKAKYKVYKSGEVNAHLNASETALFEQLLWQALVNGAEDFPEI